MGRFVEKTDIGDDSYHALCKNYYQGQWPVNQSLNRMLKIADKFSVAYDQIYIPLI